MSKLRPGYDPSAVPAFPRAAHRFSRRRPAALLILGIAATTVLGAAAALAARRPRSLSARPCAEPAVKAPASRRRTERLTVELPAGFDPARHLRTLARTITELHGPGWEIAVINTDGTATAERRFDGADGLSAGVDRLEVLDRITLPRLPRWARFERGHPVYTDAVFNAVVVVVALCSLSIVAMGVWIVVDWMAGSPVLPGPTHSF